METSKERLPRDGIRNKGRTPPGADAAFFPSIPLRMRRDFSSVPPTKGTGGERIDKRIDYDREPGKKRGSMSGRGSTCIGNCIVRLSTLISRFSPWHKRTYEGVAGFLERNSRPVLPGFALALEKGSVIAERINDWTVVGEYDFDTIFFGFNMFCRKQCGFDPFLTYGYKCNMMQS